MTANRIALNARQVHQLVAAQFPQWANHPVRPVADNGWDNYTFRLGDNMSVRLPSAESYVLQVEKEQRWLPRLFRFLPLPIPRPLAVGEPASEYPWHWSIYTWLDGETAAPERIDNPSQFAVSLGQFLVALQQIDATDGPPPGPHNFYRGGRLTVYDRESRHAIEVLKGKIDTDAATAAWEAALQAPWGGSPVWVHGDVSAGNLLVKNGNLSAVIDFGCSGVGDPACDLTIAWTLLFGDSREAFLTTLPADGAVRARGRGWALWKGLIVLARYINSNPVEAEKSRHVIEEVLADHKRNPY